MKTGSKKSTITIITLACLLAVAVASTVILAAFNASRTSTTTITFAEGLTVKLTALGGEDIKITSDTEGSNTATFVYGATSETGSALLSDNDAPVTLDGINAELNKDGYIAYQVTLLDNTNTAIAGAWTDDNGTVTFAPTAEEAWEVVITLANTTDWDVNDAAVATFTCSAKWVGTSGAAPQAKDMFSSIVIQGSGTDPTDVNALAGKTIKVQITLKADTENADPFGVTATP